MSDVRHIGTVRDVRPVAVLLVYGIHCHRIGSKGAWVGASAYALKQSYRFHLPTTPKLNYMWFGHLIMCPVIKL
jgi:hypothetical protein